MLKQTFQWGSWDITFVEWTRVTSTGGYKGEGVVAIVKPFHYTIFIDGTTYDIYFKDDNKFAEFKAIARNDKKTESCGYNYAYHPGKIRTVKQGVETTVVAAGHGVTKAAGVTLAVGGAVAGTAVAVAGGVKTLGKDLYNRFKPW